MATPSRKRKVEELSQPTQTPNIPHHTIHACILGYCPGSSSMVRIPDVDRGSVLPHPPFNWTKTDIENRKADDLYVCGMHLKEYKPGSVNGTFVMYAEGEDPINLAISKGELLPQPDYLKRMNLTLDQFKKNLQTKVDRKSHLSNPSIFKQTELEALQADVVAAKLALATANKSHGGIQSNLKKTIEKQAEDIKHLQEKVVILTGAIASLTLQQWTGETIFDLRDVEFKAIVGLEKADWKAYLAHLDLHGASKQWTFTVTDWKTGYVIAQIKLRQNLIYPLLKKMFNVNTSSCSNIFRYFVQFAAHVSAHTMNVDRREYSELFRMTPLRYNHNKYAFTKITDMTDANEGPMQNLSNEEGRHAAHSAYYDDARIKHQVVICASCEPKWVSTAYLARGASDSEILENGTSKGLGNVAATKFYDTLSGL